MGLMAENAKHYLIIVVEFDRQQLNDNLPYTAIPDVVGQALDSLTPALDTETIYLLDEEQKNRVVPVVNRNALPYQEMLCAEGTPDTRPPAAVIHIHDRRQRPQSPDGGPHSRQ
jgi:hypothetical protein